MLKGVILAGGKGTRLAPLTDYTNKHLLPVWNQPMIMYPLNTLKSLGIKDILIVSGGDHIGTFMDFLGDGSKHEVNLTYKVQVEANGIAGALMLAKDFVGNDAVAVILGDNIFGDIRKMEIPNDVGTTRAFLLLAHVANPNRFGVAVLDAGRLIAIEEKPKEPKSNYAVTGFYAYPPDVFDVIRTQRPSARGEYEITDTNNFYISEGICAYDTLDAYWSDAGTHESLFEASKWARENSRKLPP